MISLIGTATAGFGPIYRAFDAIAPALDLVNSLAALMGGLF